MNVKEVVPFLSVSSMANSVRFYIEGLGFETRIKWEPDGQLRWCWLTLGGASLMLQQLTNAPAPVPGGINLTFVCEDAVALYHEYLARGLNPSEPEVGNGLWVTQVVDPDGYRLLFESPTDVAEDTKLSEMASS